MRSLTRGNGEHTGDDGCPGKLLIAKGITEDEFKIQLSAERTNYLPVLKRFQ